MRIFRRTRAGAAGVDRSEAKKIDSEDMGLPQNSASRPSKDESLSKSDSKDAIRSQSAKIKPRLTDPVAPDTELQ